MPSKHDLRPTTSRSPLSGAWEGLTRCYRGIRGRIAARRQRRWG
jgi:hypothetical protein